MAIQVFQQQAVFTRQLLRAVSWQHALIKVLCFWLLNSLTIGISLMAHAGQPRYHYDDSGRLKAVVDLSGNTQQFPVKFIVTY